MNDFRAPIFCFGSFVLKNKILLVVAVLVTWWVAQ
jgi:hypothetical protein